MSENENDLVLLYSDPPALVLKYREVIRIIVSKYVHGGMFRESDMKDVFQVVNLELLRKMPRIRAQYDGTSLVRTYLSSIVRNICLKLHRADRRFSKVTLLREDEIPAWDGADKRTLIRDEIVRFGQILSMYNTDLPLLLLCLKLHFRLGITREEVLAWFPACPAGDLAFLLKKFGGVYEHLQIGQIFSEFALALTRKEGKLNRPGAVQKWTNRRINEILDLMNGEPPSSAHTRETLRIILEQYSCPFFE